MTLADKMTSSRLVLAPLFFIVYIGHSFIPFANIVWTVVILWFIFLVSEITDVLDGIVARKRGEVSDFGKLFDPFADTLTQVTYFLCFVIDGIFPAFLFLIVIYREFCVLFIRNLMLKKGITMGARLSGKIKTVSYVVAGALALLASSSLWLGICLEYCQWLIFAAQGAFIFSIVVALISLVEYIFMYLKTPEVTREK